MFRNVLGPQPNFPVNGVTWKSAVLANLNFAQSSDYANLVARARACMTQTSQQTPLRTRPNAKPIRGMRRTCDGGAFVKPDVNLRLVDEAKDKGKHIDKAIKAGFPCPSTRYCISSDCMSAIQCMAVTTGTDLSELRLRTVKALDKIASAARPITASWMRLCSAAPPGVKDLRKDMNVAFIAILIDAMEWPDVGLPRCLLHGFPLAGDLSAEDSGLFRLKNPEDKAAEMERVHAAQTEHTHESNMAWIQTCAEMLEASAKQARTSTKGNSPGMLRDVWVSTQEQVAQGFLSPAMTMQEVVDKFTVQGKFCARPLPRFGVSQGMKLNSLGEWIRKVRAIDDGKRAGINDATYVPENLVMPNFEFPAKVGAEMAALHAGNPQCGMILGLEDMFAAYRRFGTSTPHATVVGVYNVDAKCVQWFQVKGMPMGLSSAPVAFCRIPAALCAIAQLWCAVACESFVDDFLICDRDDAPCTDRQMREWSSSAQYCVNALTTMAGIGLEPKKQKLAGHKNELLGVAADLSKFHSEAKISFTPTQKRGREIIATMDECRQQGILRPAQAASLLGRLNFALSAAYNGVGRAATQPLVDRANAHGSGPAKKGTRTRWTPSMTHMLCFFRELFKHMPPLQFCFQKRARDKVLVYTDASFSEARNGLGVIVIDQATGERFVCDSKCPRWLMETWNDTACNPWLLEESDCKKRNQTHINVLELLAIVAAVWTMGPDMLRGRDVVFFCDNTSAMSAAVHGYARTPHMAALSNTLHLALASLRVNAWFEWVPSAANCADIPSRPRGMAEESFYQKHKIKPWGPSMRFPTAQQIRSPRFGAVLEQRS